MSRVTYGEFDMMNEDGSITFYGDTEKGQAEEKARKEAEFTEKARELTSQWLHGIITKETYDEELMNLTREHYEE